MPIGSQQQSIIITFIIIMSQGRVTRLQSALKREHRKAMIKASDRQVNSRRVRERQRYHEHKSKLNQLAQQVERQQQLINQLTTTSSTLVNLTNELQHETQQLQSTLHSITQTPSLSSPASMQLFEDRILRDDRRSQRLIGMRKNEFEALLGICLPHFQKLSQRSNKTNNINTNPSIYSDRFQLMLTLNWLRQYPVMIQEELTTDIHERTLSWLILRGLTALSSALDDMVTWPTEEELIDLIETEPDPLVPGLERAVCIVDGSRFSIPRPSQHVQSKYYSGYKETHNINVLFVITRQH